MSIEDRIVYNSNDLIQVLEDSLDRIKVFTFDGKYALLLGDEIIDKIRQWDKTIRKQKDLPLTLTVCGEFKRGKSSLINALLQEDVVTTNITTETITTNKISYGAHKNELILPGGRRIVLSDEELQRDRLKPILAELPQGTYEIELHRPIDMLQQLTIIDTPGLGDSTADYLEEVRKALQQADAVLYVFSSLYPLSMQEQLFIKNVIKPQKHTQLLMVSNFADSFDNEEACSRVLSVLRERLSNVLPEETPLLISALDERCRQIDAKRPNEELETYLADNFQTLRDNLSELLAQKQAYVIPNRVHRLISGMTDELNMLLDTQMQGLTLTQEELAQKSAALESYKQAQQQQQQDAIARIDALVELSKGNTLRWIEAMLNEMENQIPQLKNHSVEDVKSNYALYCTDTIRAAIEKCTDKFIVELYDLLGEISGDVNNAAPLAGVTGAPDFRFVLRNKSWTTGDNIAFVTDVLFSSSFLGYITDFAAGVLRRHDIKKSMPAVQKEIQEQYTSLRAETFAAINEAYTNLQANTREWISTCFNQQITAVEAQLEQATAISRQSDQKKEELKAAVTELRTVLTQIGEDLCISTQEA